VGGFEIRSEQKGLPDSHSRSSLRYKRTVLTSRLGGYHLDPQDADRILLTSDREFKDDPCGTFLYDGRSNQWRQLAQWPDGFAGGFLGATDPWSPDGFKILLGGFGMPRVIDLVTRHETDLAAALSSDGNQLDMSPMHWSPDSQRLAVVVHGGGRRTNSGAVTRDWDMVEIAIQPLTATYVATITSEFPRWTPEDVRCEDGHLLAASTGRRAAIFRKPPEALTWTTMPPASLRTKNAWPCS
jgi:hypothetical protein